MSGRDDVHREAHEFLSEVITQDAEPGLARVLTRSEREHVNSEEAHQIAARVAREHDRKGG